MLLCKRRNKMANKPYPADAWEYVDWLFCSGRLTAEEHLKLKGFLLRLEEEAATNIVNEGC